MIRTKITIKPTVKVCEHCMKVVDNRDELVAKVQTCIKMGEKAIVHLSDTLMEAVSSIKALQENLNLLKPSVGPTSEGKSVKTIEAMVSKMTMPEPPDDLDDNFLDDEDAEDIAAYAAATAEAEISAKPFTDPGKVEEKKPGYDEIGCGNCDGEGFIKGEACSFCFGKGWIHG